MVRRWFIPFALLSLAILLVPASARANIFVSPSGTGDGTPANPTDLQTALDTAVSNDAYDLILLQAGTYNSASGFVIDNTGASDVIDGIELEGGYDAAFLNRTLDPSVTVIDGSGIHRAFTVSNSPGRLIEVRLDNLTIANGNDTTGAGGGGIRCDSGTGEGRLIISNSVVRDSWSAEGGGIWTNCYFEITDSAISTNLSHRGGGIAVLGNPSPTAQTITGSTFDNNERSSIGVASAVYSVDSNLSIANSTFRGLDGAGISGSGISETSL